MVMPIRGTRLRQGYGAAGPPSSRSRETTARQASTIKRAAGRFDYETEMLILASRKGFRVESVPITTVYSDEVSSIHPVRDTIRFFKLIRRYKKL
jgi:hypothetical protein